MTSAESAGPAEILRSVQKDKSFLDHVKNIIADICQKSFGARFWLQYHKWVDACAEFVYLALTTVSLRQTLGEEYTGLLMVDGSQRKLPSGLRRIVMAFLQCFGPTLARIAIKKFEISLASGYFSTYFRPKIKSTLIDQMDFVKAFPSFCLRLHLLRFYLGGEFYHLAKRTTGIKYILLRRWFGNQSVAESFRLLGLVLSLNSFLSLIYSIYDSRRKLKTISKDRTSESSEKQCPLCLDRRKNPSVTPCGHLFCWHCIHESLRTSSFCPLCRHPSTSSQVVPLMNYD